jgi:hypothetical protein
MKKYFYATVMAYFVFLSASVAALDTYKLVLKNTNSGTETIRTLNSLRPVVVTLEGVTCTAELPTVGSETAAILEIKRDQNVSSANGTILYLFELNLDNYLCSVSLKN